MNREPLVLGVFAAGQILAGALSLTGVSLLTVEAVLVALLAGTLDPRAELSAFAIALGILLAVGGVTLSASSTAATAAVLVCVGAVLLYGLHRYELVALGLVKA